MSARRWAVVVVLLGLSYPAVSRSDSIVSAKEHYKKGLSYYALQKYAEAAAEYEAAFELEPDAALLYNAGQAHRLAGNKKRALALYESFLRLFPGKDDGAVKRHIAALKVAIEAESKAERSQPTEPRPPGDKPGTDTAPQPKATPTAPVGTAPVVTTPDPSQPATTGSITAAPPPPRKRTPRWVWGAIVGGVVVVGVALGVGLGVGLSGTEYPSATLGRAQVP